jgi:hypothetical protein
MMRLSCRIDIRMQDGRRHTSQDVVGGHRLIVQYRIAMFKCIRLYLYFNFLGSKL